MEIFLVEYARIRNVSMGKAKTSGDDKAMTMRYLLYKPAKKKRYILTTLNIHSNRNMKYDNFSLAARYS